MSRTISDKEKQSKTISRYAIIVHASLWNFEIRFVRKFFEMCDYPFNNESLRATYYAAKYGKFKEPNTNPDLKKKLRKALDEVKKEIVALEKKKIKHPAIKIQGEYETSINALVD